MSRECAKSLFLKLALGLWVLVCPAVSAENDEGEKGKYQAAISTAENAVEMSKRAWGPEDPETADALNELAGLFQKVGEYAKAEPLFQEALRIQQKVLGSEHPETAQSLNNLACALRAPWGSTPRPNRSYRKLARDHRKGHWDSEHPDFGAFVSIKTRAASCNQHTRDYAKAQTLLHERFLVIREKTLGPDHPDVAKILNNLAELIPNQGRVRRGRAAFGRALAIREKALGPDHPEWRRASITWACFTGNQGEYAEAEPLYREALQIWQKTLEPEHPENLGLGPRKPCTVRVGSWPDRTAEATALARQASAERTTNLSKIFSFTSEQQRLAYLDIFHPYSFFPFLKGTETDLATAVLRYKGVVLDSIVEDRLLAEASQGTEDRKLVEQLNLDKSQRGQLLLQPTQKLSTEANQRIEALEREVEKIESQLAQHVAGLGQALHALGVSLEQVQPTIPNDGALFEYLRYGHYLGKGKWERRYGVIVLFSKGAPLSGFRSVKRSR